MSLSREKNRADSDYSKMQVRAFAASGKTTLQDIAELERAIYEGGDGSCELPEKRWRFLTADTPFRSKLLGDAARRLLGPDRQRRF